MLNIFCVENVMPVNNNWLAFLMYYSLKELRRRREINNRDIETATKMNTSDETMQRMIDMRDSLTDAIMLKC